MRKEATDSHGSWNTQKERVKEQLLEIILGNMEELENQIKLIN